MKKIEHIVGSSKEQDQSYKNQQSCLEEAKRRIQNLDYQSFDLSSLVQSKNQLGSYLKGGFPIINAPTLEYQENRNLDKKKKIINTQNAITQQRQDLTARNQQINVMKMEQQIAQLKKQKASKDNIIMKVNKHNESLHKKVQILQKKIQQQSNQEKKSGKSESLRDISITFHEQQQFCPQFLSPQETLSVFRKLLKKISKSSLMTKAIINDPQSMDALTNFIRKT